MTRGGLGRFSVPTIQVVCEDAAEGGTQKANHRTSRRGAKPETLPRCASLQVARAHR
jgi:hypothetical protein